MARPRTAPPSPAAPRARRTIPAPPAHPRPPKVCASDGPAILRMLLASSPAAPAPMRCSAGRGRCPRRIPLASRPHNGAVPLIAHSATVCAGLAGAGRRWRHYTRRNDALPTLQRRCARARTCGPCGGARRGRTRDGARARAAVRVCIVCAQGCVRVRASRWVLCFGTRVGARGRLFACARAQRQRPARA